MGEAIRDAMRGVLGAGGGGPIRAHRIYEVLRYVWSGQ